MHQVIRVWILERNLHRIRGLQRPMECGHAHGLARPGRILRLGYREGPLRAHPAVSRSIATYGWPREARVGNLYTGRSNRYTGRFAHYTDRYALLKRTDNLGWASFEAFPRLCSGCGVKLPLLVGALHQTQNRA